MALYRAPQIYRVLSRPVLRQAVSSYSFSEAKNPNDQFRITQSYDGDAFYSPLPAQELIQKQNVTMVHASFVECDGGGGPLGHPKVFINLDKGGPHACPYCGLLYDQYPH